MKLGGTGGTEGYTGIVAGRGGGRGEWRYTEHDGQGQVLKKELFTLFVKLIYAIQMKCENYKSNLHRL